MPKKKKRLSLHLPPGMRRRYGVVGVHLTLEEKRAIADDVNKKGFGAERRFVEAWQDKQFFPEGFIQVRAATHEEDTREKTDAVIVTTKETFRIQIKTSKKVGKKRKNRFSREGLVLLQILENDTPAIIRGNTLQAIADFRQYHANAARQQKIGRNSS